jgi:tetratricopeptide (TPR) repeat protein
MTKGSARRHARGESTRHVETAKRFLKLSKNAEGLTSLLAADRLVPNDADILTLLGSAYLSVGRFRQAIDVLRRAVALRPSDGDIHKNLGLALRAVGDYEWAIISYREAISLSPEQAELRSGLADLLFQKGRRSEAAVEYARASAMAPGTSLAHLQKIMALLATDRLGEAEEELRRLIATDASNGQALQLLGAILQAAGNLQEAGATFERLIEIDPMNAGGYQGVVTSRRFTEGDRPWIKRILSQLEGTDWHRKFAPIDADRQLMTFHFSIGKILDDLGDYAEAMIHFDAANRSRRRFGPFDRGSIERRVDKFIARFTPEFLANGAKIGHESRTPILIVGMPRSGTSLLERVVSSHPSVRGCGELDFWNERGPKWAEAEPAALAKAADQLCGEYLSLLRGGGPDVVHATDKMPFNFFWVGLVHLLFPNAVIVHCRRNPIDTCLSIYMTQFTAVWDFASGLDDLASYYRLYRRLMDHWRAVIPPHRLIEISYEDLVAEPEKTARSLIAFCGLEWDSACLHPELNHQAVATASAWQARQPIYRSSVGRWRRYEPWLRELCDLPEPTGTAGRPTGETPDASAT